MSYSALFTAVAPVFVVIAAGYLIRRVGWLSAEADHSLLRVVVNLLYPCLILKTMLGNAALDKPANLLLAPAVGFATVTAGYFACYWAAPVFGIRQPMPRRTFAFTAGIFNYGYIAIPVLQKLFPETAGVLFLHNVGVEVSLWTVGVMLLTGTSPGQAWRHILSVPVVAILAALTLNFVRARDWLPDFLLNAVAQMGAAAIPLGLLLTGAAFADQWQATGAQSSGAVGLGSCVLRLGVLPLGMLALARWLPAPLELRQVMVVQAAMPSAVIPVILARHYGADAPAALRIVLATSAAGLVTIPLWLKLGLQILPMVPGPR